MLARRAGSAVPRPGPTEWAAALVVTGVASALYALSVRNGFAYDDVPLIAGDPRLHTLSRISEIFRTPYWPGYGYFRPVTTLSFALDWALSGGSPAWFHLVNALWHALASALVFLLLRRFFRAAAALAGGLVFAVHPVHVEAVANVVGRGELLAGVFFLAACLVWSVPGRERARAPVAAIGGDDEAGGAGARPSARAVIVTAVLFALALASKESAAVLPAVLVPLDAATGRWSPSLRSLRGYFQRTGPVLLFVSLALPAYLAARYAVLGHFQPPTVHPAAEVVHGRAAQLVTALQAWPEYLRLLVFPRTLLADYGPRVIEPAGGWTITAVLGLAILAFTLVGGLAAFAANRRRTALGLLWFPLAILPVSNLLVTSGIFVAERTLYLPSVALSIGIAGVTAAVLALPAAPMRRAALGAGVAALALLAARTVQRVPEWMSTESIFLALVRDRPDAYRGQWFLGRMARAERDLDAAGRHYAEAVRLWPYRERLIIEATITEIEAQRLTNARKLATFATERWPGNVDAHRLFAAVALDLGDTAAAIPAIRAGLQLDSTDATLRAMRGALKLSDSAFDPHPVN